MRKRTDISSILVIGAALALQGCTSTQDAQISTLARMSHDHTIYLLRGDPQALAKFDAEIGASWEGGKLLEKVPESRTFRYWAFSERTASQARQFLMPAAFSGLTLEFEAYDDAIAFPEYRAELDAISQSCGFSTDPFLVTPDAKIIVRPAEGADYREFACAIKGVRESDSLSKIPLSVTGNEKYRLEERE